MSDPITRLNAALEGRYAIERELGEGGMATVYLADDLKHERKVALKVLKPELAAVVGAERFLSEIKVTANLQHPHILPLFDSGEADGFLFYVMPFVEGESLRDRIDREKQLPVDEAVRIATAVANALDHAHRHKVIHRDIKPANILLQDGEPVVADFGIALAVGAAGSNRLTETGLSLGTPYYMSPEQATGDQSVGASTDTYALGSVLYEMLVGEPPYPGTTGQAVLGKIIAGKPVSAAEQRPSIPANVDAAVRKALEKLPADRFASPQDFVRALGDEHFRYGELTSAGADVGVGPWKRLTAAFAALAAVSTIGFAWSLLRPEPPEAPRRVERFASPFGNQQPTRLTGINRFNLSPDGSKLVYRGVGNQLWVRQWNDLDPLPVRGTLGASRPAVSPDGERLTFNLGGQILVLSLQGGPVITLGPGIFPRWGPDGYIYAAGDSGAVRIPATGGPVEQVTRLGEDDLAHYVTDFLPGGDGALLMVLGPDNASEIRVLNVNTGETRSLTDGHSPRYAESGHLVYVFEAVLMAARFDPGAMELLASPVAIVDGVEAFTLSDDGKLFYSRGGLGAGNPRQLVWVSRAGQATPVDPDWWFDRGDDPNVGYSLSPDGTRLALRTLTEDGYDIWVKDLDDGPLSRLTLHEGEDRLPRWAPDGETVTFLSSRAGNRDVWSRRADGTGSAELVFDHEVSVAEGFWSPDGEWLLLRSGGLENVVGGRSIFAVRPGMDSVAQPLLAEEYDESSPAISPDGRWIAYVSTETGRPEVFVRPFPDVDAGKAQVSTEGGTRPYWAHNGRELFFVEPSTRGMMVARFETTSGRRVVEREPLFTIPPGIVQLLYDVTQDDQRFLMSRFYEGTEEAETNRFVLVLNFFEELKQRVGN